MSVLPPTHDHVVRRREFFMPFVSQAALGLEIGPSFMPTFPKREGWNTLVVDHASKEELQREFGSDPSADQDGVLAMEDVDIVMSGGRGLVEALAGAGPFHHVVACHVIEHVPDLVEFLREVSTVLVESGVLLLAVPTRELSFDFYRPLSSPGDVVVAHLAPEATAVGAMVDDRVLRAELDGAAAWLPWQLEVNLRDGHLPDLLSLEDAFLAEVREESASVLSVAAAWTGHRWVFEPASFRHLIAFVSAMFGIPLAVEQLEPGMGSEFLVVIRKCSQEAPREPQERDLLMLQTYASRQAVVDEEANGVRHNDIMAAQLTHYRNLAERLQVRYDDLRRNSVIRVVAGLLRRSGLL